LTFEVTTHVSDCGSSYFIRVTSLKFVGFPFPKRWLIFTLSGLVTLTFDLSTCTWGHFLSVNFQLATLRTFILNLHGVNRRTDGRTEWQRPSVHYRLHFIPPPTLWGGA